MAGEEVTGVTVLYMTSRLDAGDIILQEKINVGSEENYGALHDRLADLGAQTLLKAVKLVASGKVTRQRQDENKATYAPVISKKEEAIKWAKPATFIHNFVRSLDPTPGAYTYFGRKRLKVWKTSLAEIPKEKVQLPNSLFAGNALCDWQGLHRSCYRARHT